MSFCKCFQTLLGYSDHLDEDRPHFCLPSAPGGLCLIARTNFHKPPNVVESSALGKNCPDKTTSVAAAAALFDDDDDDGGGCTDQGAGDDTGAEGFLTCTETLGVESSDEKIIIARDEDRQEEKEVEEEEESSDINVRWRSRKSRLVRWGKTEIRRFPPPLPGLDQKGRPRSFLKGERKDGRFVLKEVRIERPEVFSAEREGGRLRLHLLHHLNSTQLPTIKQQQQEQSEEEQSEEEESEDEESEDEEEMIRRRGGGDEKEEQLGGEQWRYFQYQSCHHLRLSTSICPLSRIHVA